MKLNNHGWGLQEMLVLSSIMLIFLLVSVFMVMRIYNSFDDKVKIDEPVNNVNNNNNNVENKDKDTFDLNYYLKLEYDVKIAGKNFYNDIGVDTSLGGVNIYLDELLNHNYINAIVDKMTGNKCDAYARILQDGEQVDVNGYIKCDNYISEGYVG